MIEVNYDKFNDGLKQIKKYLSDSGELPPSFLMNN